MKKRRVIHKTFLLLLLVMCSVCQAASAPQTSQKYSADSDSSCIEIECDEKKSDKSSNWSVAELYNKTRDYIFGKERCVCCYPTRNTEITDLAVRDVSSDNSCNSCLSGLKENGRIFREAGHFNYRMLKGAGRFFKDMTCGFLGYVGHNCQNLVQRCRGS